MPLDNDTLVLLCRVHLRNDDFERFRDEIAEQIAKGDGVIMVRNIFDVIFVPKGTTVEIVDCIKKEKEQR